MTNDPLIKHYTKDEETGEMVPVRIMDAAEILERENLRIANTSEKMRNRVLEHEARQIAKTVGGNGHSITIGSLTLEPFCSECGRNLRGYKGPLCRYCDPNAYSE